MAVYKTSLGLVLSLFVALSLPDLASVSSVSSTSIELNGIRWNNFPLTVLVDMNQWSIPNYAFAVREALDTWMKSIWAYTSSFNDTTLRIVRYTLYVSNINATSSYDIFITFTQNEISQNVVGLTTYKWNPITHKPVSPITINITTHSRTASHLFVKNVAMHEFGHALGLGHTFSRNTQNGPELMYYYTTINRVIYPSTLDIYALNVLYKGSFSWSVDLPSTIPYKMVKPTENSLFDTIQNPVQPDLDSIHRALLEGLSTVVQSIRESDNVDIMMLVAFLITSILVLTIGKKHNNLSKFPQAEKLASNK